MLKIPWTEYGINEEVFWETEWVERLEVGSRQTKQRVTCKTSLCKWMTGHGLGGIVTWQTFLKATGWEVVESHNRPCMKRHGIYMQKATIIIYNNRICNIWFFYSFQICFSLLTDATACDRQVPMCPWMIKYFSLRVTLLNTRNIYFDQWSFFFLVKTFWRIYYIC